MFKQLHRFSGLMTILLLVQLISGMITNLFITIPTVLPHTQSLPIGMTLFMTAFAWSLTNANPILIIHSALGIIILLLSWGFVIVALRAHAGWFVVLGWIGTLAILFSALNGLLFLLAQQGINSIWMAAGFAVALIAYALGFYMKIEPNAIS
ncbi:hypothetical protein [Sulfoacidibacillus ferrooxidans]|uniref:Uncharacterized protein n=1 Tax=Sulfoacidibacillus ferrooxidans TaxID=2005001 RepID=A0A9X1V6Y3_9BACL|nr:hypothetical protein [Sulfoacidibacillus ferrooxidans]MCI0182355.1 hypothetical protein [Sulfoacidibacillus ferrooxidans]